MQSRQAPALAAVGVGAFLFMCVAFLLAPRSAAADGERLPTAVPLNPALSTGRNVTDRPVAGAVQNLFLPAITGGGGMNQPPTPTTSTPTAEPTGLPDLPPTATPSSTAQPTMTPLPTVLPTPTDLPDVRIYYVAADGSDSHPGSQAEPWQTIEKAVRTLQAGDTLYVRGGEYQGVKGAWYFRNSGTVDRPITLTNFPGEQVVFKVEIAGDIDRSFFGCTVNPTYPPDWNTPKADYIRIVGTDVAPRTLSNGVVSRKGIVMQGVLGQQSAAINASNCDYWEIAGIDMIEMSSGIFTHKNNWQLPEEHSTDHWYVHNNRVYNFYRESGMQFNGDENRIENNEIFKVSDDLFTPFGCTLINILGDHNVIKGNTLSRMGSTARCGGVGFEWDLADSNVVEQNLIIDGYEAVTIHGGDNNIIRNNVMYIPANPKPYGGAVEIYSFDDAKTDWPCNETVGTARAILPPNDPAHPDYQHYYNPRNCMSFGNQVYNNTIHGYVEGIRIYPLPAENTVIRNNVFSGWSRSGVCFYEPSNGSCRLLPLEITASNNVTSGPFGFVDAAKYDFRLAAGSPLIDAGYDLGSLNADDFDRNPRPQGAGYDVGAFEHQP